MKIEVTVSSPEVAAMIEVIVRHLCQLSPRFVRKVMIYSISLHNIQEEVNE